MFLSYDTNPFLMTNSSSEFFFQRFCLILSFEYVLLDFLYCVFNEMSIKQHMYLPKLKEILDNKEFVTRLVETINQINQLIHERDDDE